MTPEMETPGAAATATEGKANTLTNEQCRENRSNASGLIEILFRDLVGGGLLVSAALALDPEDRLTILDSIRADTFRENAPSFAADHDAMFWARNWAGIASRAERKAYALACFDALAPADQAAFLDYIRGQRND